MNFTGIDVLSNQIPFPDVKIVVIDGDPFIAAILDGEPLFMTSDEAQRFANHLIVAIDTLESGRQLIPDSAPDGW